MKYFWLIKRLAEVPNIPTAIKISNNEHKYTFVNHRRELMSHLPRMADLSFVNSVRKYISDLFISLVDWGNRAKNRRLLVDPTEQLSQTKNML
jgi:hypothetical protein